MLIQDILKDYKITKTKDKTPEGALINEFVIEINKEREANGWKYKSGEKWKKLAPIKWIAVRQKLITIANSRFELERFLSECKDYRNRNGSFSKRFFGGLK